MFRTLTEAPREGSATAGPQPWRARLQLSFAKREQKTWLVGRHHSGPLQVQRAFHPEPGGCCHLYVIHPPGGLAGGDELALHAEVQEGAAALLTTPAATKFYRARAGFGEARQSQTFQVFADASIEWLPQETIIFEGAEARLSTEVRLASTGSFLGWETVGLGRPAAGEGFARGRVSQRLDVWRDEHPLLLDRFEVEASVGAQPSWGLAGCIAFGSLVCVPAPARLAEPGWTEAVDAIRALLPAGEDPSRAGPPWLTASWMTGVLVVRYLGASLAEARALFTRAWALLRPLCLGRSPSPPRIWAT